MDFNLWFILAGVLFVVMALSVTALRRLPLTTSILYLAVGVALGSSVAGSVIDAAGARAGYGVPAVSGAVAAVVGFLGYRRLSRPAPRRGGTVGQHSEREQRHVA